MGHGDEFDPAAEWTANYKALRERVFVEFLSYDFIPEIGGLRGSIDNILA